MSNHSGSYMLNDVINITDKLGILESIGIEKTREFILKLVDLGDGYDCNPGEILDRIDDEIGICSYCLEVKEKIRYGRCIECGDPEDFEE